MISTLLLRACRFGGSHHTNSASALYHKRHTTKQRRELKEITSDPDDRLGFGAADDLDELTDLIEREFEIPTHRAQRDRNEAARRLKGSIVARKFFKKPQEVNLLTWSAKEQMRYLHEENPDQWTAEKLAESFPVSRDGAMKVLMSSFVPSQIQEITRHDRSVVKNWKALKAGLAQDKNSSLDDGQAKGGYQALLDDGSLHLLSHANGLKGFDIPASEKAVTRLIKAAHREPTEHKPGIFVSIVESYASQKQAKDDNISEVWEKQKNSNVAALQNVESMILRIQDAASHSAENKPKKSSLPSRDVKASLGKPSFPLIDIKPNAETNRDSMHNLPHVLAKDVNDQEGSKHDYNHPLNSIGGAEFDASTQSLQSLLDADFSPPTQVNSPISMDSSTVAVSSRKSLRKKHGEITHTRPAATEIGLDGTYKVGAINGEDNANMDEAWDRQIDNELMKKELKVENRGEGIEQPYVYNPQSGYQYPFGRREDFPDGIDLSTQRQKPAQIYRKGSSYYDCDGEFLFKVPR